MATVLFAAAGAAFGSGFGGTVLGLSGAVIGRAVGATVGRALDQRLLGLGSDPVEVGRVDRFRVMGASEGTAIAKSWGRMRLPGQVIWASPFREVSSRSGGGKGAPKPRSMQFSYSVSLAIALCEGEIRGVGRIWADGEEIEPASLDLRVYHGTADQMPDPVIEAELGSGFAPAYRGTAYVVIENMDLSPYGNRVPQLSFEIIRPAQASEISGFGDMIRAVALIPGTGEYALATQKVNVSDGGLGVRPVNVNSRSGTSNFLASLDHLKRELPKCGALSLVVSWFGNDLRCGHCEVQPKVEQSEVDAVNMPWYAGGIARAEAAIVPKENNRPIYGGTPADESVVQAIQAANDAGQNVMFYPFILMEKLAGNGLPDPYGYSHEQAMLPWRGRITLSTAPSVDGSPDLSEDAEAEVEAFFGTAEVSHFSIDSGKVFYSGPKQWTYRRFILHYAHLCKLAGGVEAFCVGSELRGLTQVRGAGHSFPTVIALKNLAADVRALLGDDTKISYAADWSEYFGYHRDGHVYFHLDPLWADSNIDFIGIDNYMPLSDWRDDPAHLDAKWKTVANIDYLKQNVCGGEGFDWYYDGTEHRDAQRRTPIEDNLHHEPWVFRYKDLRSWWENTHHNRIDGVQENVSTSWVPKSKPIWFTEYGCAAIDKGTNEPNKFWDEKSSESAIPQYSNGVRDDYIQFQYYRAINEYWNDPDNNPLSDVYLGAMISTARLYAWAWDARPYPEFPRNEDLWSDGVNYHRGHWLNGRASAVSLEGVVREICCSSGIVELDTKDLHGMVSGYGLDDIASARSSIQPLSAAFGFDAIEAKGALKFLTRGTEKELDLLPEHEALSGSLERTLEISRLAEAESIGRSRLIYISAEGDFSIKVADSAFSDKMTPTVSQAEFALALTSSQAKSITDRWLAEVRTAKDVLKVRLPMSSSKICSGSILKFMGSNYRVDRVEVDDARTIESVRVERSHYTSRDSEAELHNWKSYSAPSPVYPIWMDLPLLRGSETPHAPHVALSTDHWPGDVAIWNGDQDEGYSILNTIGQVSIVGVTLTPLAAARPGLLDRGPSLKVRLFNGELTSVQHTALLNGSNTVAIGDGSQDVWELFQFEKSVLVADNTYELSGRLRGQVGSDAFMPREWPVGSTFVFMDSAVSQISILGSLRGVTRHYRVGSALRGYDDADTSHHILSFRGNGLRPYRVAHLKSVTLSNGDCLVAWIRRTRVDGDSWEAFEVPLGEEAERYLISIKSPDGLTLRTEVVLEPFFNYAASDQVSDGAALGFNIEVSQVSGSFGVGATARLIL